MEIAAVQSSLRPFLRGTVQRFAIAWLLVVLVGVALAVVAQYVLADAEPLYRRLVQTLLVVQFVAVGMVIAGRQAVAGAIIQGVTALGLGRRAVAMLFDRFNSAAPGETGSAASSIAGLAARLPLPIAEERLNKLLSVFALEHGVALRRGLLGRLQSYLFSLIGVITLARFRSKAQRGSVDVSEVRNELEATIDELLLARVRYTLNVWTAGMIGFFVLESLGVIYLVKVLATSQGPQ